SMQVNVNITGRHVEVTQPLRDYVVEKAERLTRYFDRISRMQVTLNVEGDRHIAEMILSASKGAPNKRLLGTALRCAPCSPRAGRYA
ncbi:MAG: ribosome-associated translation inhibitor RaiA, partial [Gammaproteobacteria bacterium]|nr:ribosome-associated translation inhibitor RaiA [Gammaproteobacteria bacterium]